MAKQSVTIDGVEYASRTAAAKALIAGGMSLAETAEKVGMTYQTVYANTKGLDKVKVRRAKYRILALGKTGRSSVGEIAKKVGVTTSRVVAILKKANLTVITAEMKAKAKKDASPKATKAPKAPKAPKVSSTVEPVAETTPVAVVETPAVVEATVVTA